MTNQMNPEDGDDLCPECKQDVHERCPTCAMPVHDIFDHIDIDCEHD
jgi:hypothetical protein